MPRIMKLKLALLFSLFTTVFAYGQNHTISGKLIDSSEGKSVDHSVIALLNNKDSSLISFTRARKDGSFSLNGPDSAGHYIIMATHPYFGDFFDAIDYKNHENIDIGSINMISKIKLLEEVVVKGNRSMYLKGDTTVFTADSFKVAKDANVEELLKKLPGIQVDRTGKITAMGEQVKKVLVDGEEFFGTDPGIATKNLRADVVDKVEVFDKKSDQSAFTGIDDGVKDKTINLKLKEDKKKGYFGKTDAGGGYKDRFYGSAMINAFQAKRKIAAFAITSNTGWMNLDWQDSDKFGGGNNMEVMEGGGIIMWSDAGDYNSSNGIPTNYNGGIHYSNKFKGDTISLNSGYKYVRIDAPGNTRIFQKNFTTDSSWNMNSVRNYLNRTDKHSANLTVETKIDSANTLKLTATGNLNYSDINATYDARNFGDKSGYTINNNSQTNKGKTDNAAYNANLLWMHKFKKPFRTLSINTSLNHTQSKTNSFLYSKTDFYENNIVDSTAIIDQNNLINNSGNTVNSRLSYTEPLAKDFYMETSYRININKRNNTRNIMMKSASGAYDNKIDSLSNDFDYNELSHSPGINFRYNGKKINTAIGSMVEFSNYKQDNLTKNTVRTYSFNNYYPQANFSYKLKPSVFLRFNYNGRTSAPTLDQLQPILDNTNPLNQYIGNPYLRPSFSNNFNIGFNSFKMLSERSIWTGINYGFTNNAFTRFTNIKQGVQTTQTVNANGVSYFNFYGNYNKKIKKLNFRIGFSPNISFNNNVDFIANAAGTAQRNETKNSSYRLGLSLSRDVEKKYNIYVSPNYGYNIANATINTFANAKYWSAGADVNAMVYLPKKFELRSSVDAEFRQKDPRFPTNNNFVFWNADLQKKILKEKLVIKFAVNDILNQRNGYSRNFNSFQFTETYNNVLQRNFLLGVVWNFSKMNGQSTPNNTSSN